MGQREGSLKGSFVSTVVAGAGTDGPPGDVTVGADAGDNVELDAEADERTMCKKRYIFESFIVAHLGVCWDHSLELSQRASTDKDVLSIVQ